MSTTSDSSCRAVAAACSLLGGIIFFVSYADNMVALQHTVHTLITDPSRPRTVPLNLVFEKDLHLNGLVTSKTYLEETATMNWDNVFKDILASGEYCTADNASSTKRAAFDNMCTDCLGDCSSHKGKSNRVMLRTNSEFLSISGYTLGVDYSGSDTNGTISKVLCEMISSAQHAVVGRKSTAWYSVVTIPSLCSNDDSADQKVCLVALDDEMKEAYNNIARTDSVLKWTKSPTGFDNLYTDRAKISKNINTRNNDGLDCQATNLAVDCAGVAAGLIFKESGVAEEVGEDLVTSHLNHLTTCRGVRSDGDSFEDVYDAKDSTNNGCKLYSDPKSSSAAEEICERDDTCAWDGSTSCDPKCVTADDRAQLAKSSMCVTDACPSIAAVTKECRYGLPVPTSSGTLVEADCIAIFDNSELEGDKCKYPANSAADRAEKCTAGVAGWSYQITEEYAEVNTCKFRDKYYDAPVGDVNVDYYFCGKPEAGSTTMAYNQAGGFKDSYICTFAPGGVSSTATATTRDMTDAMITQDPSACMQYSDSKSECEAASFTTSGSDTKNCVYALSTHTNGIADCEIKKQKSILNQAPLVYNSVEALEQLKIMSGIGGLAYENRRRRDFSSAGSIPTGFTVGGYVEHSGNRQHVGRTAIHSQTLLSACAQAQKTLESQGEYIDQEDILALYSQQKDGGKVLDEMHTKVVTLLNTAMGDAVDSYDRQETCADLSTKNVLEQSRAMVTASSLINVFGYNYQLFESLPGFAQYFAKSGSAAAFKPEQSIPSGVMMPSLAVTSTYQQTNDPQCCKRQSATFSGAVPVVFFSFLGTASYWLGYSLFNTQTRKVGMTVFAVLTTLASLGCSIALGVFVSQQSNSAHRCYIHTNEEPFLYAVQPENSNYTKYDSSTGLTDFDITYEYGTYSPWIASGFYLVSVGAMVVGLVENKGVTGQSGSYSKMMFSNF